MFGFFGQNFRVLTEERFVRMGLICLGYNSKIANNNCHNSTKIGSVYKKVNIDIRDETRHSVFAKKEGVAFKQTT